MSERTNAALSAPVMRRVVLSRIRRDPAYQVRPKMDPGNVERLKQAFTSGREVDPITVAEIEGHANPLLIDGWHRVTALLALGYAETDAIVVKATAQEAKWLAAKANLSHGLPLDKAGYRNAFRAFIRAKRHIVKRRRGPPMLSYREIAQEIGMNHSTIRRWMMDDFPKIAKAYGEGDLKGVGGLVDDERPKASKAEKTFSKVVQTALETFKTVDDPAVRGRLIEALEAALSEAKAMGDWVAPDF